MQAHLSRKQKREIKAVVERSKLENGIPQTAQQSIPFQRMFPDGICRVTDNYYTKTIQFQDINYQLAQQEDKTAIFDEWCSFLNFFDSSIHFELSFMNMSTDADSFEKSIRIPYRKDSFNPVRAEYSQMLRKQLSQGNNGLTKTKYLTFGITAESMRQAKPRLIHIENDLINNFRRLGVTAKSMNGKERLNLMHTVFHMGDEDKFFFNWVNSDFIYMLNQASEDRGILAKRLNISPHQLSYVTNSGEGEGLLFYGNVILPFVDRFPTDTELYRIMTTKLSEVVREEKEK